MLVLRGEGVVYCGHFVDKGRGRFIRCWNPSFCDKKFKIFRKLWYDHKEGVEALQTFFKQGARGSIFATLCGRLLVKYDFASFHCSVTYAMKQISNCLACNDFIVCDCYLKPALHTSGIEWGFVSFIIVHWRQRASVSMSDNKRNKRCTQLNWTLVIFF